MDTVLTLLAVSRSSRDAFRNPSRLVRSAPATITFIHREPAQRATKAKGTNECNCLSNDICRHSHSVAAKMPCPPSPARYRRKPRTVPPDQTVRRNLFEIFQRQLLRGTVTTPIYFLNQS